ncbi:2-oxo-4-hydroxy-4-carboxy-5-ureidoimidazoline decarboxylase [Mucilaginibacter gracilis]|uniref:2-oxo-4-hydroxy-4-carboxy-5-ureidoimidazoline decarboxylase n=1 Tax=Mucilaginibacter gracilis TaxID=423350 RepID=A0A495J717_9SPHI|nr:2-oxo-4-hydroxy-4-carboxy-5-ureidoimidazoline decarboxylase [Mucilaginibacter gracilis]RKR83809.1 2-oxo-4-hydroxy-4-carboxy-5-ureidoimidazoline decarboxylase [Mucilaginibacter gracilis]
MTIAEFDHLSESEKQDALFQCCGSTTWVNLMLTAFPVEDLVDLLEYADEKWQQCKKKDWLEAFTHHPKIGDVASLKQKFASTANWASGEQAGVNTAPDDVLNALAKGNTDYEEKFGFIFIVCATGKSAGEMLWLLQSRLPNDPDKEIEIAAAEQAKITRIRLEKLFA